MSALGTRTSTGCLIAGMITFGIVGAAFWLLRSALDERTETMRRGSVSFLLASIDPVIEALPTPGIRGEPEFTVYTGDGNAAPYQAVAFVSTSPESELLRRTDAHARTHGFAPDANADEGDASYARPGERLVVALTPTRSGELRVEVTRYF